MYVICWVTKDATEFWDVVHGKDAVDIFISDLMDNGISWDDIVIGEVTDELNC